MKRFLCMIMIMAGLCSAAYALPEDGAVENYEAESAEESEDDCQGEDSPCVKAVLNLTAERRNAMAQTLADESMMNMLPVLRECEAEYKVLAGIDFDDPLFTNILIMRMEDVNLLKFADSYGLELSPDTAKAARSRLLTLPMYEMNERSGPRWTYINTYLEIDAAVSIPELNGMAYIFQWFSDDEDVPGLVTAVLTTQYPLAITHTEFLSPNVLASMPGYMYDCFGLEFIQTQIK